MTLVIVFCPDLHNAFVITIKTYKHFLDTEHFIVCTADAVLTEKTKQNWESCMQKTKFLSVFSFCLNKRFMDFACLVQ